MAEATRFELVVRLPVRQFSKLMVSATHPHFLLFFNAKLKKCFHFSKSFLLFVKAFSSNFKNQYQFCSILAKNLAIRITSFKNRNLHIAMIKIKFYMSFKKRIFANYKKWNKTRLG